MAGREKYHHYKRLFLKRRKLQQFQIGFDDLLIIKHTHRILIKNRMILQGFFLSKRKPYRVSKKRLMKLGFMFNLFTGATTVGSRSIYRCYEFFYLAINEDWYTIGQTKSKSLDINITYDIETLLKKNSRNQ